MGFSVKSMPPTPPQKVFRINLTALKGKDGEKLNCQKYHQYFLRQILLFFVFCSHEKQSWNLLLLFARIIIGSSFTYHKSMHSGPKIFLFQNIPSEWIIAWMQLAYRICPYWKCYLTSLNWILQNSKKQIIQ